MTERTPAADNLLRHTDSAIVFSRHVEQANRAVTLLALLIEQGRKENLHGEVSVTVFFKEGGISGIRNVRSASEK